jgi:hypothetical protein
VNFSQEPTNFYELLAWHQKRGGKIFRNGNVIHRPSGPWTPTLHTLLRHFESVGFAGAPRVVGTGFDSEGLETLSFIEGEFVQPGPWTLEGATGVGKLLRNVHDATSSYHPPPNAVWAPWFGRDLGGRVRVIGHCDAGPWNIVARNKMPTALIDWEYAGPVDPLVDLAQACWLNAQLHSDDVAERQGLPPLADRARQLRAMVDAYGLTVHQRRNFVDTIIEFAVHSVAAEADEFEIGPDTTEASGLWGMAWRARSAAWMLRNRSTLQNALA